MATDSLTKYTCDECEVSIIAETKPRGWVRLLSTKSSHSTVGSDVQHHSFPPVVYSPSNRVTTKALPEKGWWCSAKCLSTWVHKAAEDVIERAKLNH